MIALLQLFREHIGYTCSMYCQMTAAFTVTSFSQSYFICRSHQCNIAQSAVQCYTLPDDRSAYPTGLYARCRSTNISYCVHCIDRELNSVTLWVGIWETQLLSDGMKLTATFDIDLS